MSRIGWEQIEDEVFEEDVGITGRLLFLRILFLIVLSTLLYRVWSLQQNRGADLQALAEENQFATLLTDAPRGVIFDRNGDPLALNKPSFNVTITPAFLPDDDAERLAIYERLSLLTGVPVTNTVQQQELINAAEPELVNSYSRLAQIYGAPVGDTLDQSGVVPRLPDSIEAIVLENSFAQYVPAVITSGIPITMAYTIEQESIFLPGVRVLPAPLREYPSGEATAQLIGFMGPLPNENWLTIPGYERDDRVGWAGLESSMEFELAGRKGERVIEVDWTGREVRQIGTAVPPTAGLNLHLTLDLRLQEIATQVLSQAMAANEQRERIDEVTGERSFTEVQQGAVVAIDPQTGEILAMVTLPGFDNNRFQTEVPVDYVLGLQRNDYRPLSNHAINGTYPPGSTFKIVPGIAALGEGLISPSRRLVAPGEIAIANRFAENDPGRPPQIFVCWNRNGHGLMDAIQGMANSCDIYYYKITGGFDQDGEFVPGLGIDRLVPYASQFGFGRLQGVELPLEAPGRLPTRVWKRQTQGAPWSTGDDYNIGIGQGFLTSTPMQVAQMAAVIANGGFLYRPQIIHHMTDEDGNIVIVDEDNSQIVARASLDNNGEVVVSDASGNELANDPFNITFDAEGNYIFQPEVIDALEVDQQYIDVIAEGLRLVNIFVSPEEFYTGATWVDWPEPDFGLTTAGKTGTAEYCDNIAIERGWCSFDDILLRRILPTHSWYVGYAPFDEPEIVVSAFLFNGGEGSAWAAPVACNVIAAFFELGQYADGLTEQGWADALAPDNRVCNSLSFNPIVEPRSFAPPEVPPTPDPLSINGN